jgi:hypothetical protein
MRTGIFLRASIHLLLLLLFCGIACAEPSQDVLTVESISFSGNTHTRDALIRRMMYVHEGARHSAEELRRRVRLSEQRLRNTFYFYQVEILTVPADSGKVRIQVDVMEGFLWRISGTKNGPALGYDNLFGRGEQVSFDAGWQYQAAQIYLPYLAYSPFNLTLSLFHGQPVPWSMLVNTSGPESPRYRLLAYERGQLNAAMAISYSILPDLKTGIRFKERSFTRTFTAGSAAYGDGIFAKDGFSGGVFLDFLRVDNFLYPHRGVHAAVDVDGFPDYAASQTRLSWFLPLGKWWSTSHNLTLVASEGNLPLEGRIPLGMRGTGYKQTGESGYAFKEELRLRTPALGLLSSYAEFYAFGDYGRAYDASGIPSIHPGSLVYGPGLRAIFSYPILVVADLIYFFQGKEAGIAFTANYSY